jgi:hypothetical protein
VKENTKYSTVLMLLSHLLAVSLFVPFSAFLRCLLLLLVLLSAFLCRLFVFIVLLSVFLHRLRRSVVNLLAEIFKSLFRGIRGFVVIDW